MKVTQITVKLGQKISQNYNSWTIDLEATADLEPNEGMEESYQILTDRIAREVSARFNQFCSTLNSERVVVNDGSPIIPVG